MKLVSKCGSMFIDMPEGLDYDDKDVKLMVEDLQETLDNISDSGYFLYLSDLSGSITLMKKPESCLSYMLKNN